MAKVPDRKTTVRFQSLNIQFFIPQHHLPACCVDYVSNLLSDKDPYRQLCGVGLLARLEPHARPMTTRWAEDLRAKQMRYLEELFIEQVNAFIRKLNDYVSANGEATWSSMDAAQILLARDQIASAQWVLTAAGSTYDFERIRIQLGEAFSAAVPRLLQGTLCHHISLFHTIASRDTQAYWARTVVRP